MAQPSKAPVTEIENLAGFSRIVARLRTRIQRRPPLQGLLLKVDAIGDTVSGKEENFPAWVSVAAVDGFRKLGGFFAASGNGKRSNGQGSVDHNSVQR